MSSHAIPPPCGFFSMRVLPPAHGESTQTGLPMAALVLLRTIGNSLSVVLHGERDCGVVRLAFLVGCRGVVIAGADSALSGVVGGSGSCLCNSTLGSQRRIHLEYARRSLPATFF